MPALKINKDKTIAVFDIEEEILKPLNQGYLREAVARLDGLIDKVIEAKINQKLKCREARSIIRLVGESRSSLMPIIAHKLHIISKGDKEKIEKFKSFRNIILHNALGEIELGAKRNVKDINEYIRHEVNKGIKLLKELVNK